MRISLLEKRENFEQILKDTLAESSYFEKEHDESTRNYYINKYLNFIATNNLPENVFQILVNEYTSSLGWWKKGIQSLYVRLAISKRFRVFFSHNTIKLPSHFEKLLILGGNHRLRLFSVKLESSYVLLKNRERDTYIKNDIAIRKENNIQYAPQILNYGKYWLEEEYFEGIPINRLENQSKRKELTYNIFNSHFMKLNLNDVQILAKSVYESMVRQEISHIISIEEIEVKNELIERIQSVLDLLFTQLREEKIKISWSHGDFQQANILVVNDTCKVVDWESSDKRFYFYDAFILFGKIREGTPLSEALDNFRQEMIELNFFKKVKRDTTILLLIEELRFNINETFSVNFFESGIQTENLCDAITKIIDV